MSGLEVGQRLREQRGRDDLLLIAMTGFGQDEDRRRSLAAGFDCHLVKPVNPPDLLHLLSSGAR
jgi:two-component system CheB/CheR fusion protein